MEQSAAEALIKSLAAIAAKQDSINDDLRAMHRQQAVINRRLEESTYDIRSFVQQQGTANAQHTAVVMRIARTLDLIDEKLERLFPPQP
jgi:ribosomal protein S9